MFSFIRKLQRVGLIGINRRNLDYIATQNSRKDLHLVDDKLVTKARATALGIDVPELYGLVQTPRQARDFRTIADAKQSFVIKPVRGSGGNGILVVDKVRGDQYFRSDGTYLSFQQIEHHIQNILSGVYSLSGLTDQAMIEYRVKPSTLFDEWSFSGVPDIRVVLYKGVPAMAMLRLPTRESGGRANLHQGAVGVGINLTDGVTTNGIYHDAPVDEHPDYGTPLAGLALPNWNELLSLAARCQKIANLGYMGVDIVIDQQFGPLVLELNARPGLAIQLANRTGLAHILNNIDQAGFIKPATIKLLRGKTAQQPFTAQYAATEDDVKDRYQATI